MVLCILRNGDRYHGALLRIDLVAVEYSLAKDANIRFFPVDSTDALVCASQYARLIVHRIAHVERGVRVAHLVLLELASLLVELNAADTFVAVDDGR